MDFRDTGGGGPPVVFLHGLLVDGTLWDASWTGFRITAASCRRCRSGRTPSRLPTVGADAGGRGRSRRGPARAARPARRDGGRVRHRRRDRAIAGHAPAARVARLILTPCDALEVFPPALFVPLFKLGRFPSVLSLFLQPLRCAPPGGCRSRSAGSPSGRSTETARGLGGAGAARPRDPARRGALRPPRLAVDHARRRAAAAVVQRRGGPGLAARGPLLPDRSGPPTGGPVLGRAASWRSPTRTRSWPSTSRTCSRR